MQRCGSKGFTLVEVLVAMFVLSVGAAGAAATQSQLARLREQAALESEAVQLAASL
ncbi:MAG TPA: type IV pilus modification protein PilV, partial [Massilia sp.]|nr:type IV pilus modification protein PilV [Massilia sp.]